MNKTLSIVAALVIGLWVGAPAGAQTAGPAFEDSGPDQGDFEHEAPYEIFIQFSEALDQASSAQVYDECGRRLDDGLAEVRGDTVWAQLALRPSGRYLVVYSATGEGAEAGTTEGSFTFRVHFGPSCGGGPGPTRNGPGPGHGNGHGTGAGPGHGNGHGGPSDDDHGGHAGATDHDQHDASSDDHPSSEHAGEGHDGGSGSDKHQGGHGRDHGSGNEDEPKDKNGGAEGNNNVALPGPGLSGFAPPPDIEIALTAIALCIALGLFGGFALRASGR